MSRNGRSPLFCHSHFRRSQNLFLKSCCSFQFLSSFFLLSLSPVCQSWLRSRTSGAYGFITPTGKPLHLSLRFSPPCHNFAPTSWLKHRKRMDLNEGSVWQMFILGNRVLQVWISLCEEIFGLSHKVCRSQLQTQIVYTKTHFCRLGF